MPWWASRDWFIEEKLTPLHHKEYDNENGQNNWYIRKATPRSPREWSGEWTWY
jgi:hypothetical protein